MASCGCSRRMTCSAPRAGASPGWEGTRRPRRTRSIPARAAARSWCKVRSGNPGSKLRSDARLMLREYCGLEPSGLPCTAVYAQEVADGNCTDPEWAVDVSRIPTVRSCRRRQTAEAGQWPPQAAKAVPASARKPAQGRRQGVWTHSQGVRWCMLPLPCFFWCCLSSRSLC